MLRKINFIITILFLFSCKNEKCFYVNKDYFITCEGISTHNKIVISKLKNITFYDSTPIDYDLEEVFDLKTNMTSKIKKIFFKKVDDNIFWKSRRINSVNVDELPFEFNAGSWYLISNTNYNGILTNYFVYFDKNKIHWFCKSYDSSPI